MIILWESDDREGKRLTPIGKKDKVLAICGIGVTKDLLELFSEEQTLVVSAFVAETCDSTGSHFIQGPQRSAELAQEEISLEKNTKLRNIFNLISLLSTDT